MTRKLENRVWLLVLLVSAIGIIAACSSSSTTGGGEEKDAADEDATHAHTQG